ncbi:MAG TPA: SufE family protein [Trueperaceae bacterium]
MSDTPTLTPRLSKVVEEFSGAPKSLRLPLLLEYAGKLPSPPEDMGELEQVHECQTPLFLKAIVEGDGTVRLHFAAPEEAPTTRGFASVVHAALDGAPTQEVLSTPEDFYTQMGLAELISPLRLRGMSAIVTRVKRQVREQSAA